MTTRFEPVARTPGCRWLGRVMRWGLSRNGNHYSPRLGPEFIERLHHAPVGCYLKGRRFEHREGGLIQTEADLANPRLGVGLVEEAWADRHGLYAVLHLVEDVGWLRNALLKMEHDRVVTQMGLSIDAQVIYEIRVENGRSMRDVKEITRVHSLDLVTVPSADGCLLRSIPRTEDANEART